MIIENNKEKIKKNFKLILSILAIIIACAFLLFFNQPQKNESDIAKIINNRNKIILHNPNTNLKAEDRWLESAENKLEVYEEFQKNYGNDKSKIESQINQIDEKYNQIISKQNELIQGQSNQIEELKNQFKTKPNNNSKDPFGANNEAVVANKTIQNYMESLNESEKKELVQFLNSDDNELKTNFSSLKESVLTKLETLKESSDSETIGRINETIEKVSSEKYDKLTYFKLKGLKEKL